MMFGLIVVSAEAKSTDNTVLTNIGDKYWVISEPDGWVPATSVNITGDIKNIPAGLKVWETKEEAEKFGKKWKGHPWWCVPISFEVIEVKEKTKQVFDGWEIVGN
jgi:hypothetical protein